MQCLVWLQVHQMVNQHRRLEAKLDRIYLILQVLSVALFLLGLYLFLAFVFDFFPFEPTGCSKGRCRDFTYWRDFT